ncbi:aldehyde dehydrogenase family protein, partial [Mesorhizobium sp. M7D.F.Ca.US.004.01.2.1]|uniref:aldehyde dehydrogenase family protein n=1 Tax=Mesorhizobium sp. M7D.F.Ca.US.004.01.2.1 TaxID=2496738 RepID=UPI001FDEBB9E
MLIDGAWCDALSGRTFETRNPATGTVIGTVPLSDSGDIDLAVAAARRAFDGPWSRFKPYERQVLLLKIADLMERHWEEIALSDTTDMGMPIVRTLANKNRVLGMLRFYAGMATSIHGHTIGNSLPGEIISYTRKEPVGVVGAIIPWNAPTAASIWKIGPALATGCTIVLKPSEEAPLTPLLIGALMMEAGVPPGVVNVVTGTGAEAGAPLAAHMDVDKIVFTGSTATGQNILRASAGNMKRVSLELGGKSPVIVCADADLERAVPIAAMSVFANSGQICIAGSRLFVERPIYDEFVERVSAYAAKLRIGDGADPETEIGPLISLRQLERVTGFIEDGTRQGARLVTGGNRITEGALGSGNFIAPSVFSGVTDDMRIAREEIFGPVISALPFDTLDEVVRRGNDTPYGLGAGVFTRDLGKAHQLANRLRAGSV